MPRKKPTRQIDVIGRLDARPEEAVPDYLDLKLNERFYVLPPEADSPGDSIELLYINNHREYDAMRKLQEDMLEDSRRQGVVNAERVARTYKMQDDLRKRFISVNNFIKDCDDKKRNAQKAVNTESVQHSELRKGIVSFKSSIDELKSFREVLKATVQQFEPYEQILKDVVKHSDIFVSSKDCMARCDALMLAQVEIHRLQQQKLKEIEEMRKRMITLTNDAALTVVALKNDLARMERDYNESQNLCFKREKVLATCKNTITFSHLEKERTLDAVLGLYRMLLKRRGLEPISRSRGIIEPQMDFIKREIEILVETVKEYEQQFGNKSYAY